ncbi:lipid A deacylase LpxR family protein [Sideroxyarcus emersonii]
MTSWDTRTRVISQSTAILTVSLAIIFTAPPAIASETTKTSVLTLMVENDLFYHSDRDYTNGIALVWGPSPEPTPDWAVTMARLVPWFPKEGEVGHGYTIGQNMYTPRDITVANPPLNDRPYGGWLYGSMGMGTETGRQLDLVTLTLGVVGPASQAEQAQKAVHKIVGSPQPQGWNTQLKNELGILLTYQRSWRALADSTLDGLAIDLTPDAGFALGNVYTYASAGLTLRYGKNLTMDYGPPRIQPSPLGTGYFATKENFTWYLFTGFEMRAVARNIFLDGNTFQSSRSVEKKPFVSDFQWGVVTVWNGVHLTYTHVVRTREFKTQGGSDQFGAFSISTEY